MAPKKDEKKADTSDKMTFDFNTITNHVTVVYNGKKTKLPPSFKDYRRAKEAAEEFAKQQGWKG